jgi:Xaa-Pro aminopeptidase
MIKERGLDALVVFSPENVLYTSGCQIETQRDIRDRLAASVFIPGQDPALVLCKIELAQAEEESWIKDLVPYIEFADSPIAVVVKTLKSRGVDKGRIGIDLSYLAGSFYDEFKSEAPQASLEDCTDLMVQIRAIKTPEEVEHQERITRITVKVIEEAFGATKVGDTDLDVYNRIVHGLMDNGGKPSVAVVAAAERGSVAHPTPSNYKLKSGDVMRVDIVGFWGGYMSDVARTVCVGEPSQRTRENYTKLARIQKSIIDMIKPDIPVSSLYNFCAESFAKEGLPFGMPHIGHGMGLEIHEYPMIHPANHDPIKEGMVLNIEPLLIDQEQRFGYHIEDLLVVTADGRRVMTGTTFPMEIPLAG